MGDRSSYCCAKCGFILQEPMQDCCGNRVCRSCAGAPCGITCRDCQKPYSCKPDKAAEMEKIKCENKDCSWTGYLKTAKNHFENCRFQLMNCQGCDTKMCQDIIRAHRLQCLKLHTFDNSCFYKPSGIQETQHYNEELLVPSLGNVHLPTFRGIQETQHRDTQLLFRSLTSRMSEITTAFDLAGATSSFYTQNMPMEAQICDFPTNGVMKWQIPHFSSRQSEGLSDQLTSIYSLPFYTTLHGYKLRLRLHANGYNDGINSHMSLFACLIQGESDHLLTWPAKLKATFKLLNMRSGHDTVTTCEPILPRPTSQWGDDTFAGFFQFIGQQYVSKDYVMDDTVFIQSEVLTQ